ncbi:metal-sensitive transcriptional regulator [Vagococcus hydrophili]|uniref:Metal-sensitive transcriptional regulator n=1 Tax=Vagococcus hydrophili TaxID=2714947 RepID=A0A6G8AQ80_9ENTE|nr:metal-sensitive transcriptional regulator [Vagococcus hydrophili]QIL47083.1 metal-sensitive transcriptional regulator [Vagococcus hydrophili]
MTETDETRKKIKNRLKRSEGQIRGVIKMVEDEQPCRDIVIQLSAIRSSIDRAIGVIVAENLKDCLTADDLTDEKLQEAIDLVVKK